MRQLNESVVAGGVVYPAGTAATPELEELIPGSFWVGVADPASLDDAPVAYLDWKKAQLEAELEKRNADRDPDGDAYIHVEPPGNKPELAAALEADDASSAD